MKTEFHLQWYYTCSFRWAVWVILERNATNLPCSDSAKTCHNNISSDGLTEQISAVGTYHAGENGDCHSLSFFCCICQMMKTSSRKMLRACVDLQYNIWGKMFVSCVVLAFSLKHQFVALLPRSLYCNHIDGAKKDAFLLEHECLNERKWYVLIYNVNHSVHG